MHPGGGGEPYEGDHKRDKEQPGYKRLETPKPTYGVSGALDHRAAIIDGYPIPSDRVQNPIPMP